MLTLVTNLKEDRGVLSIRAQEGDFGQKSADGDAEPLLRLSAFFHQCGQECIHFQVFQPVLHSNQRIERVSQKL